MIGSWWTDLQRPAVPTCFASRSKPRTIAAMDPAAALARVREACLALPEVSERESHGAPSFFVRGTRCFAMVHDDHHGDGRLALWVAAPPGAQALLVDAAPDVHFVPPYVGHQGWVGVRLDRGLPWEEVEGLLEDAWLTRAPARLAATLGEPSDMRPVRSRPPRPGPTN
jgi:hypothetical protein